MTVNAKNQGKGYPWLVKSATRYHLRNYYEKSAFRKSFLLCEAFCGSTGFHKSIGPFVVIFWVSILARSRARGVTGLIPPRRYLPTLRR